MFAKYFIAIFALAVLSVTLSQNASATTIKYNVSGKYVFGETDPGFPIVGAFDWSTDAGLLDWGINLIGYTSVKLTDRDGGTGRVTPTTFQFLQSKTVALGNFEFTMNGTFTDSLPTEIGKSTTFDGTYLDQFFFEGKSIGDLFTISGTAMATSFADDPPSSTPEPSDVGLIGLGLSGCMSFMRFRRNRNLDRP